MFTQTPSVQIELDRGGKMGVVVVGGQHHAFSIYCWQATQRNGRRIQVMRPTAMRQPTTDSSAETPIFPVIFAQRFLSFSSHSRSLFPLNCAQRQYWHNQFASWMCFDWYLIWTKFYFENPAKWRMQCTIASKSMDCPVCKMVVHGSQWAKWTMARCNHGATDASFHYANHDRDGNNNMIECNHGHTMPNWSSQSKTNKHHRHDQNTLLVAI